MAQQSYGLDQVMESMMEISNILDSETRTSYKTITIGRGRRQQLINSTGRFCVAFRMEGIRSQLCYRIWKELIPDAMQRYKMIGNRISKTQLEYFSGFRYVPSALKMKCDGSILPGIVMEWIEGKKLDAFMTEEWSTLSDIQRLTFIRDFYYMCHQLRENGISHGDLSCMNILVTPERHIRLVDYDSLFVPEMGRNFYQTTGGAPAFQHPDRTNASYPMLSSLEDDNFSQLVIALSLWVAYFDPSITQNYDDSNLLFLPADMSGETGSERLRNLKNSNGWKRAEKVSTKFGHIPILMKGLESIQNSVNQVPSLLKFASKEVILSADFYRLLDSACHNVSSTQLVPYCTACGQKFGNDEFKFCTACGTKRHTYTVSSTFIPYRHEQSM